MTGLSLSRKILAAAKRQKIGVEALRLKSGLGGGTFYCLLRGDPWRTKRVLEKLRRAGVAVPPRLLSP